MNTDIKVIIERDVTGMKYADEIRNNRWFFIAVGLVMIAIALVAGAV